MPSSVLGVATLAGGVVNLWPMQESGGTTAGDMSGVPGRPSLSTLQYGVDGDFAFGSAGGIVPEGSAAGFTPVSYLNGITLANDDAQFYAGADFTAFCQFAWSGTTGVDLLRVGGRTGERIVVRATPAQVSSWLIRGDGTTRQQVVVTPTREGPHWVALVVSGSTATLWVDDESTSTEHVGGFTGLQGIEVGSVFSADPVQIAWAGFADRAFSAAEVADLALLATGGSERSDERIARVLGWLGMTGDLEVGSSDVGHQSTADQQALDVINEVNSVEQGVFFTAGDGRMVQHARAHRFNTEPRVTLTASQVDGATAVTVDMARVVNDYTVSRPGGASYRSIDADSVSTYGRRASSATLPAASDDDLRAAADAWVAHYAVPAPRIPSVTVDLLPLSASDAASVLGLEIGDRLQITGMPSTTPGGTTVDLMVEGMEESVAADVWAVTLSTSPASLAVAWLLGDPTWSELGTTTVLATY